jgi:acyl-CoA oxidase
MLSNSTSTYPENSPVPYRGSKLPTNRQMDLMATARARRSFSPEHLTDIIYQGSESLIFDLERLKEVLTVYHSRHKQFKKLAEELYQQLGDTDNSRLPESYGEIDRTEMYRRGLRWGRFLFELQMKGESEGLFASETYRHAIGNYSPFGLHFLMFVPTIKLQGSMEQQAYWLPLCERGAIIGTYAQTELGHGTFVRGLETTATFDPKTDEFVVHSPTVTSTKFWPGSSVGSSLARMPIFPNRWPWVYLYPCHRHGAACSWHS